MSDSPEAREPGWRVVADDGSHEWECDCYGDLSDCPKRFEGSCHARTIPNAEDRRVTALEATNAEQARRIERLTEALEAVVTAWDSTEMRSREFHDNEIATARALLVRIKGE